MAELQTDAMNTINDLVKSSPEIVIEIIENQNENRNYRYAVYIGNELYSITDNTIIELLAVAQRNGL